MTVQSYEGSLTRMGVSLGEDSGGEKGEADEGVVSDVPSL